VESSHLGEPNIAQFKRSVAYLDFLEKPNSLLFRDPHRTKKQFMVSWINQFRQNEYLGKQNKTGDPANGETTLIASPVP
jgi:hypothetical protein|tara:strand:- start:2066 stop:2302 length:237 start_codon:yes stop_codon:yes gene_type:complete